MRPAPEALIKTGSRFGVPTRDTEVGWQGDNPEMSTPDTPQSGFTPFVPEDTDLPELTFRAVALGVLMAIVLGAANAYLGMRAGLTVAATPSDHRGDQIPGSLGDVDGLRILLPRSDLADDELPASLRDKGAGVDAVTAYRTTTKAMTAVGLEALDEGVDAITFTSPSTIRGLVEGLGVARARVIQEAVVASIGPVTSEAARALGVRVDVEASESSARGLVEALSTYEGWVHHASSTAP